MLFTLTSRDVELQIGCKMYSGAILDCNAQCTHISIKYSTIAPKWKCNVLERLAYQLAFIRIFYSYYIVFFRSITIVCCIGKWWVCVLLLFLCLFSNRVHWNLINIIYLFWMNKNGKWVKEIIFVTFTILNYLSQL